MLKYTIVCVMLVAAAAMGWARLDDVPNTSEVEHGAHLTWGNGLIWAMLPVYAEGGGNQRTDVLTCNAFAGEDSMWDDSTITPMSSRRLLHAGLTFQWKEQPVLWGCGWHVDQSDDTWSKLYSYVVDSALWRQDTIDVFELGDGASIAYYPNGYYHALNYACPGWIYCLRGGSQEFWRYAIPGTHIPDMAEDGFYPGPGAVIADQTPPFQWGSVATPTYRLLVSTNSQFSDTVIDEQVSIPEYEPEADLDNGTYYWRTAAWVSSAWSWSGTRTFDLQGGWQSLAQIPESATSGAIIAYDSGSFGSSRSILALPGGNNERHFYRYIIAQDSWVQQDTTPGEDEDDGTSLTTRTPTQAGSALTMAAFSSSGNGDVPYSYTQDEGWDGWCNESGVPIENSHFPRYIGPYSSMVIGGDNLMYLLPGCTTDEGEDFYWVELPGGGGGGAAGASQINGVKTHVIAGYDGIEVEYQLPVSARVRATLHDAIGRQVGALDLGQQRLGTHRLSWNRDNEGRRLSAGAYFVLLDMGTEQSRLKAVVR